MAQNVQYGVLSTARIARNQHIPAAQEAANSEIVAISSRDAARAESWAKQLGIPRAYGSYDALLADPGVDAVINPLPNGMHCEWTVRAAEAGKHILCEKPLAVTVDEAQRMIAAAEANGVLLMEGFTQHFLPHLAYARRVIESGEIGALKIVRAELVYTIQDWEDDVRVKPELAGGALLDAGCYCVNTIRALVGGEPLEVQAFQRAREGVGVDTTFVGLLRFPDDVMAFMATGMEQPFRGCCELTGTLGRIEIPTLFGGELVRVTAEGETREVTFTPGNRFALQLAHFSDAILHGTALVLPPEDALANTRALVALQQAADQGRAVAVPGAG
jgi:predicted dehydrogenase